MRIDITDADIDYAERLLLPPDCHFNDERREFIRCMESRDVVACPGSGKTTALLAKLLILARRMPFADGRGVCVLTHTNVAIDEIKKRAGMASLSLFRYPNFFGTIHSFVGTYLAMPAYVSLFGHRQIRIDDDYYRFHASRVFFQKELNANGVIYNQVKKKLQGRSRDEQLEIKKKFFIDLSFRFENGFVSYYRKDTNRTILKGSRNPRENYLAIHSAKYGLLERGILRYQDIFPLGWFHLTNNDELPIAFRQRFSFVFIDEMQDSDKDQVGILNSVFPIHSEQIVQRIGDPNQAIYHGIVQSDGYWTPRSPLHFSDSRRFGDSITHILSTVRLNDSITLQPNPTISSYPPFLITFEDGEEQKVLRAFSYLIEGLADPLPPNCTCKAVGWIGKDNTANGKLCIPSYFPEFGGSQRTPNRHFPNLISYAAFAIKLAQTDGPRHFLEIVLQGITRGLNITGIRDETSGRSFTVASLKYFWKRAHEETYLQFRERLAESFLLALDTRISPIDLREQINSTVQSVWPSLDLSNNFFTQNAIETSVVRSSSSRHANNRFVSDNGIVIEVGTVHSVKGETHFATLFLETEYQQSHDASRLIEFLKGNRPPKQLEKPYHKQNLKIAHVAFSRPTHLLAFACQTSSIASHEDDLKNNGWQIRRVSELIASRSPEGGKGRFA